MFTYVKKGQVEELRKGLQALLKGGRSADDPREGRHNQTLLHKAVKHLQPSAMEVLLEFGARCEVPDHDGNTALHMVVQKAVELAPQPRQYDAVVAMAQALLAHLSPRQVRDADVPNSLGTPLIMALRFKQEPVARLFLEHRCNPAAINPDPSSKGNALHLAIGSGSLKLVKAVLKAGHELGVLEKVVNHPNAHGVSPLHVAVAQGWLDCVQQLLLLPFCNTNAPDDGGNTPLHVALQAALATPSSASALGIVRTLLKAGCALDAVNQTGQTPVSLAVDLGARVMDGGVSGDAPAKALLEPLMAIAEGHGKLLGDKTGPVFSMRGTKGMAAIHLAARLGSVPMLTGLAQRNADVNALDAAGQLPTVLAAQGGHKHALLTLLSMLGADPLAQDRSGISAAAYVLLNQSNFPHMAMREITHAMLRNRSGGAARLATQAATSCGAPGVPGQLPLLHLAAAMGNVEAVQLLVSEAHVAPDAPNTAGLTPLAAAVIAYCESPSQQLMAVLEFLVAHGCNPVTPDAKGDTPLGRAIDQGLLDVVMALLRGSSRHVNYRAPSGATALYLAIVQGEAEKAAVLVTRLKASTAPQPAFIPLHVAVGCQRPRIVELLLTQPEVVASVNELDANHVSALGYLWRTWKPGTLAAAHEKRGRPSLDPSSSWQLDVARLLVRVPQCDVNAADAAGKRPLHIAVQHSAAELVRVLAAAASNLDPNLTDAEGLTPLQLAVQRGDQPVIQALLESLPNLNMDQGQRLQAGQAGRTPLQAAIAAGNAQLVAQLAAHPATHLDPTSLKMCLQHLEAKPLLALGMMAELLDPERTSRCGINLSDASAESAKLTVRLGRIELPPLHLAARLDQPEAVRLLVLQARALPEGTDTRGLTALHYAVDVKAYKAAKELVALGADVGFPGKVGTPALINAASTLDVAMVRTLLEASSPFDINATDSSGHTALTVTVQALLNFASDKRLMGHGMSMQNGLAVPPTPGAPSPRHRPKMSSGSSVDFASMGPGSRPASAFASSMVQGPNSALSIADAIRHGDSFVGAPPPSLLSPGVSGQLTSPEEIFWALIGAGADVNHPMPSLATFRQLPSIAALNAVVAPPPPTPGAGGADLLPSLSTAASLSTMTAPDPEVVTPLIAAIQFHCASVVTILLSVPEVDVNGRRSSPPLAVALQGVASILADEAAARVSGSSTPMSGVGAVSGAHSMSSAPSVASMASSKSQLLRSRKTALAAHPGATSTSSSRAAMPHTPSTVASTPGEALQAAIGILQAIASDPRLDYHTPVPGSSNLSPLLCLVEFGGAEVRSVVLELLAQKRDLGVNYTLPTTGRTALHLACLKGDHELIDVLCAAPGIDYNLLDESGHSPLACAVLSGSCDAIRCLVSGARNNLDARAALDPCAAGPDPRSSPVALALANPDAAPLRTMLTELAAANSVVMATGAGALSAGAQQARQALKLGGSGRELKLTNGFEAPGQDNNTAAAPGSKYNIEAVVSQPVDRAGRSPVLAAMKALKLEHAEALVLAGAPLDVAEPSDTDPHLAKSTPLHLLFQYIVELEGGKAAANRSRLKKATQLAAAMAVAPSMARAVRMQDITGFTVLHWAVLAKQYKSPSAGEKSPCELLTAVARKAGVVNLPADTPQGKGFTALHLAAQLGLPDCVRFLLLLGDAKPDIETRDGQTPLLMTRVEEIREMLHNPPTALRDMPDNMSEAGCDLPVIRKQPLVVAGLKGIKDKLVYAWGHMTGVPDLERNGNISQSRGVKVQVERGRVVIGNTAGEVMGEDTSMALYGGFRAAVKSGIALGQSLGPVGAAIAVACTIADQIMTNMEKVVINNIVVAHICGRIRRQVPILKQLKTRCERLKDDARAELAEQLMAHVSNLGEVYIEVHKLVLQWSSAGKAKLISRMLASSEYYDDFMRFEMILTSCMTDLGTTIAAHQLLDNYARPEPVDKDAVAAEVRSAITQDMQLTVRDILENEAVDQDSAGSDQHAQSKVRKLFEKYGLDYNRLKSLERKRWKQGKLRDLIIPYKAVSIVTLAGTGGTAQVYEARWQGFPVAYKQFEALPGMMERLREAVEMEGYIMSTLRHPNVIQCFGIVTEKNRFGLVVDFHPRGSLQGIIETQMKKALRTSAAGNGGPRSGDATSRDTAAVAAAADADAPVLSIQERVVLGAQIARGMTYLHGRAGEPIVHGDLKPSNVLLAEDGRAVITDFGMARVTSNTTTSRMTSHTDTFTSNASAIYGAPELPSLLLAGRRRPPSSDVFSFGVLLYELLLLKPVWEGFAKSSSDCLSRFAKGERPPIPSELPDILRFCVAQCWHHTPEARLNFPTVVSMLESVIAGFDGGGHFIA